MAGKAWRQAVVVRHHDDGLAFFQQALEDLEDVVGRDRVQAAGRFIRHDDGRVVGQRPRDRHTLLLSAGNEDREFMGMLLQFDQPQQFHGAFPALAAPVQAAQVHRQHHVLQQAQHGQQLEGLVDHAHVPAAP